MGAVIALQCYCSTLGVMLTLMNFQTCHHDNIQCNSDTRGCLKLNTMMNTDTYSLGYIYKLKTLHSRVDEVGKLMLRNKLYMYMYIHIQDIP